MDGVLFFLPPNSRSSLNLSLFSRPNGDEGKSIDIQLNVERPVGWLCAVSEIGIKVLLFIYLSYFYDTSSAADDIIGSRLASSALKLHLLRGIYPPSVSSSGRLAQSLIRLLFMLF